MPTAGLNSTITKSLGERLQRHLCDEETALVTLLDAVRQLHQSLRDLDGEAVAIALQNEISALHEAEGLQVRRQTIRTEVAGELGITPQEFTLGLLVARTTGGLHTTIVESRQRLTEMSAEMERLNRQNSAMIQQSLQLIRDIEGRLTGTAASGESYGADGGREEAHVGSLVQWGG